MLEIKLENIMQEIIKALSVPFLLAQKQQRR